MPPAEGQFMLKSTDSYRVIALLKFKSTSLKENYNLYLLLKEARNLKWKQCTFIFKNPILFSYITENFNLFLITKRKCCLD